MSGINGIKGIARILPSLQSSRDDTRRLCAVYEKYRVYRQLSMILIAIGANLPGPDGAPPLATCRAALSALAKLPGLQLQAASGWWETAAMPPSEQPPYVNGVAHLSGDVEPAALLARLHALEDSFGRERGIVNSARTLDLDIIAIGEMIRYCIAPILPHPRAHLRAFVLEPLLEVAPNWVHPGLGRSGADLLAALPPQLRRRL